MSLRSQSLALLFAVLSFPAILLISQVAFNPLFDVMPYTGYLFTWSAAAAIPAFAAMFVSMICDCFSSR